jgi:hypothetical protein
MIVHAAASREALVRADGFWSSWRLSEKFSKIGSNPNWRCWWPLGVYYVWKRFCRLGMVTEGPFYSCVSVGVWMEFENPAFEWLADRALPQFTHQN